MAWACNCLKMRTRNIFHSTTRVAKRDREVLPAVRGRRAKAEEDGLPSHLASVRPESALFRPGAVGPPARIATACGGGRPKISTLSLTCPRPEAVHRYASAQPIDFLAPFGAALGNPEMAGHQTVRASTKNASFPTRKLQVSHKVKFSYVHPGFRMDTS